MIRLAIVDDNSEVLSKIKEEVKVYLQQSFIEAKVYTFQSSKNLIYEIEDNFYFDIILMDIEMPEITGMDLAKYLKSRNSTSILIFITSHLDYAINSFELSIFRYIYKPILQPKLNEALRDAIKLINDNQEKSYQICTNFRFEKILYKNILYLYKEGKNTIIFTNKGISKVRKSLKLVFSELDSKEFIYIDRGYIVNIKHINKISNHEVILKNDQHLLIGRSHLKTVKYSVTEFWRELI